MISQCWGIIRSWLRFKTSLKINHFISQNHLVLLGLVTLSWTEIWRDWWSKSFLMGRFATNYQIPTISLLRKSITKVSFASGSYPPTFRATSDFRLSQRFPNPEIHFSRFFPMGVASTVFATQAAAQAECAICNGKFPQRYTRYIHDKRIPLTCCLSTTNRTKR